MGLKRASATVIETHAARILILAAAGSARQSRYVLSRDGNDSRSARETFRHAANLTHAPVWRRIHAASLWAQTAAEGTAWSESRSAWSEVIGQLPQVVGLQLDSSDRQRLLRLLQDVGTGAAAAHAEADDAWAGWQALEQGRGVLLGQALDLLVDPELRAAHPDLARRADHLRHTLNRSESRTVQRWAPGTSTMASSQREDARPTALHEWHKLVAEIRERPGFENFGRPPSTAELRGSASDGSIVAINVSPMRCDAFVLSALHDAARIPLPALTFDDANRHAEAFLRAAASPGRHSVRLMVQVLEWLWDTTAGPVLDWLGHRETPRGATGWRRVWWMPTGALSTLPMHAAGHYSDPLGSTTRRAVLDRVISSLTPTVRALTHARRRLGAVVTTAEATVVGVDAAEGLPPLTYAAAEARWVHEHLRLDTPPLVNAMATREQVLASLQRSRWAHFACHGIPADDPADSRLALADGPLRVRDLTHLDLPSAYLAYLSACTSASGGTELPNESIHIASSLQAAGFPHVIGTLWRVGDHAALRASRSTYSLLARGHSPAEAVHWTQHSLREADPFHPNLWGPLVHIGP